MYRQCNRWSGVLTGDCGAYQWLPLASLRSLSPLKQLLREAELLASLGLLAFSRNGSLFMKKPGVFSLTYWTI